MRASGYVVSARGRRHAPRSNREVINLLRSVQQQLREVSRRMDRIQHRQEQLALRYCRQTATFTISRRCFRG